MLCMAGAALLATGCVYRERVVYRNPPPPPGPAYETPGGEVQVMAAQPATPPPGESDTEVIIGPPPFDGAVWVGGYWGWGPGRWVWYRGHWGRPPYRGAVWVGPRYDGGRRVWVRGGWR
jgi:hypothetical protein